MWERAKPATEWIRKLVSQQQLRSAPYRAGWVLTRTERIGHELHSSEVYAGLGNARVSGTGLPLFPIED